MICPNCGRNIPGNPAFCSLCGKPTAAAPKAAGFSSAGDLGFDSTPARPTAPRSVTPPPARPAAPPVRPVTPPARPVTPPAKPTAPPPSSKTASAPTTAPAGGAIRRISAGRELKLLLWQGWLVMKGEMRNLIISLLFPLIAGAVTVWVAGEDMFICFEGTKAACFILVCAAIWGGLFNSIQCLVKERENIKRDYVSGALRIECYMASRAILQFILCLIQSIVLTLSIPVIELVHNNSAPGGGLLIGATVLEYFITIFLIMYGADAMGLMISSMVKKEELASKLAPYILIAQLLFSGMLFEMEGAASALSAVMLSRWGMEALGSTSNINNLPLRLKTQMMETNPMVAAGIETQASDAFEYTASHMGLVWVILLLFIVVPLIAGDILLHRVKKDTR